MIASRFTQPLVKKLAVPIGIFSAGVLLAPIVMMSSAHAASSDRKPGSFICTNNPDPACNNPTRSISGSFRCTNNPGPECKGTPSEAAQHPAGYLCQSNQNVNCGNPIRFSVKDPETWRTLFPQSETTSK